MQPRDPPHYLKALKTTGTPKRLLWLDCASATGREHGALISRWAGGALGETWWTSRRGERRDTLAEHADARELWEQAAGFCKPGKRAVLFSHDLAYQLRISAALIHLPALGFHLERIVLERAAAWALFRQGKRSLLCCDLQSWTPAPLERIAADLELSGALGEGGLVKGCSERTLALRRAVIVREACLQLFGWINAEGLGPFRPTGSGQSYAAYRRRFLKDRLLVHDDETRLHAERVAMWTGRCEAWRHGRINGGPFTEYDMTAAYCTIVGECQVPSVARGVLRNPKPARLAALAEQYSILAEVEVNTEIPLVPARLGERTTWPVGHFRTVLWEPELGLVLDYAQKVKCSRAWLYDRAPALKEFAGYTLEAMGGAQSEHGQLVARVAKHWSRCLVGRLGLRYRGWEHYATLPEPDLRLVTWLDVDEGTATDMLIAGTDALILAEMTEARDSLPQIPGWVMSECRRRLWQAMIHAGLEHVVYVDTDSMILAGGAQHLGRTPITNGTSHHWAVKGHYRELVIHGPRNLTIGDARRVAGLPLSARQVAPLEFTGQVMRSIKESVRTGELDHVASIPRRFILDAPDLRRQHLPDGQTQPYRIEVAKPA